MTHEAEKRILDTLWQAFGDSPFSVYRFEQALPTCDIPTGRALLLEMYRTATARHGYTIKRFNQMYRLESSTEKQR